MLWQRRASDWCHAAFKRALRYAGLTLSEFIHLISDRTVTTSSAFSGIATEITSGQCIEAAAQEYLASALDPSVAPLPTPIKYECLQCIEKVGTCQEGHLNNKRGPACLHSDILMFCPLSLKARLDKEAVLDDGLLREGSPA